MVPTVGGPKTSKPQSSWDRRRRSTMLPVSLKHWKGRGVQGGGGVTPLLLRCTAVLIHPCPCPRHTPTPLEGCALTAIRQRWCCHTRWVPHPMAWGRAWGESKGGGCSGSVKSNCQRLWESCGAVTKPPAASSSNTSAQGTHKAPTHTRGTGKEPWRENGGKLREIANNCEKLRTSITPPPRLAGAVGGVRTRGAGPDGTLQENGSPFPGRRLPVGGGGGLGTCDMWNGEIWCGADAAPIHKTRCRVWYRIPTDCGTRTHVHRERWRLEACSHFRGRGGVPRPRAPPQGSGGRSAVWQGLVTGPPGFAAPRGVPQGRQCGKALPPPPQVKPLSHTPPLPPKAVLKEREGVATGDSPCHYPALTQRYAAAEERGGGGGG